jgi:NTE family protein
VDLVLQGGGVLGIALVGYIYALEEVGIRFLSLGGSSAGAINATLIAALGTPAEAKSAKLLEYLAGMNAAKFLDGSLPARRVSTILAEGGGPPRLLRMAPWMPEVLVDLWERLGLHPGQKFYEWLHDILKKENVETTAKLEARMADRPKGLRVRPGREEEFPLEPEQFESNFPGRLAIVAVDAMTKTKFVFPEMAQLIFEDRASESPATYVRASMSIPWLFQPHREGQRPDDPELRKLWEKCADYHEPLPSEHLFVDGGMVSNFPINVLHRPDRVPLKPTFGVRLGVERRAATQLGLGGYTKASIDSARQALDADFLFHNPDYRQLIGTIHTEGFNWLDFRIDAASQRALFARGVAAAEEFLLGSESEGTRGFDWAQYKQLRASLKEANRIAKDMNPAKTPTSR